MMQIEAGTISPKRESPLAIASIFTLGFVLLSLLLASPMLIRGLLFQPFNIPAGSMKPTLLIGDYFFVSKYAYGCSRFTWPFDWPSSKPPSERILGSMPERGDVVAFLLPTDNATTYIKRVVGLPGDRIQMKSGVLYINDQPVPRERLDDVIGSDPCGADDEARTKQWRETLPNGRSYTTLDCVDNGFYDTTNLYTVPAGHLFMLGDNRDNSTDSRVLGSIGYVPIANVIGRASMIFFSTAGRSKSEPGGVRWGRIGTMVR